MGPGNDGNGGNGYWNGCARWDDDDDCDDDDDGAGDDDSDNNGSIDPSALGLSTSEMSRTTRIITVHAVLASLVWVL